MPRWFLRRARILPGPLKTLQQAQGRAPVPVTSLALTSALIAAGLALMPQLSPQVSVDPQPTSEFVEASPTVPEARVHTAPEPVAAVTPAPVPVEPSTVASIAPAPPKAQPTTGRSLFELELLPVLEADGVHVETDAASTAPKAAPKPARRAAAPTRVPAVAAIGQPAQR